MELLAIIAGILFVFFVSCEYIAPYFEAFVYMGFLREIYPGPIWSVFSVAMSFN
jgi:hypothetical protein